MLISKPILPPIGGYVERVDFAGNHYYEATAETKRAQAAQAVSDAFFGEKAEQGAEQMRAAVQMFAVSLPDEKKMIVPSVFPAYEVGKAYVAGDVFSYGENSVGDPQLYQVLQAHTSAAEWMPDASASLYKPVGVTAEGYPEWAQPVGASDAYNTGDIVSYNGALYRSVIDGNVWNPEAYPAGWEKYEATK